MATARWRRLDKSDAPDKRMSSTINRTFFLTALLVDKWKIRSDSRPAIMQPGVFNV